MKSSLSLRVGGRKKDPLEISMELLGIMNMGYADLSI